MRLNEIAEWSNIPGKGVYTAVKFSPATVEALEQYSKQHNIANPTQKDEYHCTVLYSRRPLPNLKPLGKIQPAWTATGYEWDLFENRKKTKHALVLKLRCSPLYQHYHKVSLQHGATSDFPTYQPHVTFSYDAGDMDISELPLFDKRIKIVEEYQTELDDS